MMNNQEALKMAIEALLTGNQYADAINACKEALSEQEPRCQYADDVGMPEYKCEKKCQYEQQAQEPVAITLLKEARKIIRASSSRNLAKDWDARATEFLNGVK